MRVGVAAGGSGGEIREIRVLDASGNVTQTHDDKAFSDARQSFNFNQLGRGWGRASVFTMALPQVVIVEIVVDEKLLVVV